MKRTKVILALSLCIALLSGCGVNKIVKNMRNYNLNQDIINYLEKEKYSGSAMVVKDDMIRFSDGFGYIDSEKSKKIVAEDSFEIGSLTKQMTAAAVLKLNDEKKLNINDSLDKYFPEYKYGDKITLRNLLNMNSGIKDYLYDEKYKDSYPENIKEDVKNTILGYEWDSSDIGKYEYCNSNYFLLGLIIEMCTDMEYMEYMSQEFFEPIGMPDTQVAVSERVKASRETNGNMSYPVEFTFSAGSLLGTIYDLYQWEMAYWNGKVISQSYLKEIREYDGEYIYGWKKEGNIVYHIGQTINFKSIVYRDLEDGTEIILLSNDKKTKCEKLATTLAGYVKNRVK